MNYVYTHRGFVLDRLAVGVGRGIEWYANAAVDQYYADLNHTTTPVNSWEWRSAAIETVLKLFSLTPNFFATQLTSGQPMPPRALDFLYSTLNFIRTGRRSLSVFNWIELLDYHPTLLPVVHRTQQDFMDDFGDLLRLPLPRLIALWLQQPMGLQDLILTAYVIFGALPEHFDKAQRL